MKNIIYVVLGLGILFKLGYLSSPFSQEPTLEIPYGNSTVLYSTAWCGYCKKTRALLEKHGIEYTEFDIERSSEGKQQYEKLNGVGVPLLLIGDKVVRGYDPKTILKWAKAL